MRRRRVRARNWSRMIGIGVIALLVVMAIFGKWIAPVLKGGG